MTSFMGGSGGITFSQLLKDGAKHFSGTEEAVVRNINACSDLADITRSSLGPNGMNKLIKNHLEKLFVTNDAATIIREMEVVHPAAKLVGLAAATQQEECGDATNLVVVFAGEILKHAEGLLKMGLHISDIVTGYVLASKVAIETFEHLTVKKAENLNNVTEMAMFLRSVLAAKQYGLEDKLAELTAKACVDVLPRDRKTFSVDNIRICKIMGGNVSQSHVVNGFVLPRDSEGVIKHALKAKIAVFSCGFEAAGTETKGTVLLKTAKELETYSQSEETAMEKVVKELSDAGITCIVTGGAIGEMALHFLEKYKIMAVKCPSKFESRRICKAIGAVAMARVGPPTAEEIGHCDVIEVKEIGDTQCVVFRQDNDDSKVSTIVLRSSTQNVLDDLERALEDAVNIFKQTCKDGDFLAGAGAAETEVAIKLQKVADETPGLEQYAIRKFGEAFEVIPKTLAHNAGQDATEAISTLYAAHNKGQTSAGVNIEEGGVLDAEKASIFDHKVTKIDAIRLASNAAITVLRVDQIIMAKQAGGPKLPPQ